MAKDVAHEQFIHQLSNERVAERLRDFAAIALSDGREHMAKELKFLADREEGR